MFYIKDFDDLAGKHTGIYSQVARYIFAGILEMIILLALYAVFVALAENNWQFSETVVLPLGISACVTLVYAVLVVLTDDKGYYIGILRGYHDICKRCGHHITKLPLGWFDASRAGEVSNLLTKDFQIIMDMTGMFLRQEILAQTSFLACMVVCSWVYPYLSLIFVVFGVVFYCISKHISDVVGKTHKEEAQSASILTARMLEFARMQPTLRASINPKQGWELLLKDIACDRAKTLKTLRDVSVPMQLYSFSIQIFFAAVGVSVVHLYLEGIISAVSLAFVIILLIRTIDPIMKYSSMMMALRVCKNALVSIKTICDTPVLPESSTPQKPQSSRVEFKDVSFSYSNTQQLLHNISFVCEPNSLVALVGPSGSGKTTLTRLIARFWDVSEGEILIDGINLKDIRTQELMSHISMVFQDVYLFDGTIEENIRFGNSRATDEEVMEAAHKAQLDEVAQRLPQGWETPVGEGGNLLSGGERARVAIARALLKKADIILFDEATAALDAENEASIVRAMHELSRHATVIVIAHRLSTIVAADKIVVINNGKVEQIGSHKELIGHAGTYRDFWNARTSAQHWRVHA